MARYLRPPENRITHPFGVLAIAVGVSLLVIALLSSRPSEQSEDLAEPASVTSETVLGEVVEQTTLLEASPAEAAGFTTTTPSTEAPPDASPATAAPPPPETSPTIGPPVSITAPPSTTTTRPPTTTTTAPPTTTTFCNLPPCE